MERAQYVAGMATILYERLFIVLAVIHQIPLLIIVKSKLSCFISLIDCLSNLLKTNPKKIVERTTAKYF